jgi:NADH:ubiquinone oxidoreductase subunit 6 (subunit J)
MGELIFLGLITIIATSAIWVVVSPNLVHSAVSLLFTLFGIAGLYVFLFADFLAATQVVIYVGGILVLIIFGVMLTNKIDKPVIESVSSNKIIGVLISSFIFTILSIIVIQTKWPVIENSSPGPSTVELIGKLILGKYLLPFELVSILLLAALVGAALLARKKSIIEDSAAIDKVDESENIDNDLEKVDNIDENKIEDEEK